MLSPLRITPLNARPIASGGRYVLYWMIAARRTRFNAGLERAAEHARELGKPLVVLEALRCGHPHASLRFHQFVLDGMRANARAFERTPVRYHPYLEPSAGAGKGLLEALAKHACVVVSDDYPTFFLPRMLRAAAAKLDVLLEAVDGNGIVPIRAMDRVHLTAYSFRRALQKVLPEHLVKRPLEHPLRGKALVPAPELPREVTRRWPHALQWLERQPEGLAQLPIDTSVRPSGLVGGAAAARKRLDAFLDTQLLRYQDRNHPDEDVTSGLSPYLHWGHIGAHEVLARTLEAGGWSGETGSKADGSRTGWWGVSPAVEGFLDQLVTWRELGFNMCVHREDADRYDSLPEWARRSLERHASDPRPKLYTLKQLASAATGDPLWNASQRQLLHEGRIHNYLRMLWGKKILEWSVSPRAAAEAMVELNDRFAFDGRDPNSYSGIFWVLGRYDRPWAPERPIFGVIRYMTSESAARKLRLRKYLARWGPAAQPALPGFEGA